MLEELAPRLIGLSPAKAATHSLAAVFGYPLRSAHEPEARVMLSAIFRKAAGVCSDHHVCEMLRLKHSRWRLDVDSSQLNFPVLNELLTVSCSSRFVLVVRDCYSWLNSIICHSMAMNVSQMWRAYRDLRFSYQLDEGDRKYEKLMIDSGLYPLRGYLRYWGNHYKTVLARVPRERLFVVRIDEFGGSLGTLAEFANLPTASLRRGNSREFVNRKKVDFLGRVDKSYLERAVGDYCRDMMEQFFPEMAGF